MELSEKLVSRLVALRSLLDLGDMELVAVASSRLDGDGSMPEIAGILDALRDHRYAEAAAMIDKLLSDGIRPVRWIDPEIQMLDAELERVAADLADLETEQAELEHLVARFEAAYNEVLGARIERLLKLRMFMLEREVRRNPKVRDAYDKARQDFREFKGEREVQKQRAARTKWDLSEEQQAELKQLFRTGSKRCHPDVVSKEDHDAAAAMFRELRKAYEEGNLARLRQLVRAAEAGLFAANGRSGDGDGRRKARLKARIAAIREALERTKAGIREIKLSPTYRTMTENPDWELFFGKQGEVLDKEIERLSAAIGETQDDDA